jgi:hypothetical protein
MNVEERVGVIDLGKLVESLYNELVSQGLVPTADQLLEVASVQELIIYLEEKN